MRRILRRVTRKRVLQVGTFLGSLAFIIGVVWAIGSDLSTNQAPASGPPADQLTIDQLRSWFTNGGEEGTFFQEDGFIVYQSPYTEKVTFRIPRQGRGHAVAIIVVFTIHSPDGTNRVDGFAPGCFSNGDQILPTGTLETSEPGGQIPAGTSVTRTAYFKVVTTSGKSCDLDEIPAPIRDR